MSLELASLSCPECGKTLKLRPELTGRKGRCPGCGHTMFIPVPPAGCEAAHIKQTTSQSSASRIQRLQAAPRSASIASVPSKRKGTRRQWLAVAAVGLVSVSAVGYRLLVWNSAAPPPGAVATADGTARKDNGSEELLPHATRPALHDDKRHSEPQNSSDAMAVAPANPQSKVAKDATDAVGSGVPPAEPTPTLLPTTKAGVKPAAQQASSDSDVQDHSKARLVLSENGNASVEVSARMRGEAPGSEECYALYVCLAPHGGVTLNESLTAIGGSWQLFFNRETSGAGFFGRMAAKETREFIGYLLILPDDGARRSIQDSKPLNLSLRPVLEEVQEKLDWDQLGPKMRLSAAVAVTRKGSLPAAGFVRFASDVQVADVETPRTTARAIRPAPIPQPPAGDKSVPRLTASVKWGFKEGSGGFVITPHCWSAAVSVVPADGRTWTAIPDLVIGEAAGSDAIAQGASGLGDIRPAFTFFGSRSGGEIPSDTTGEVSPLLVIDGNFILGHEVKRDWQLNGKSVLWRPTQFGRDDRLDCIWEHATGSTFNASAKAKADYRPFHLGPLFYDATDPDGPCYALAAFGEKVPGRRNEWVCDKPEVIPLTAEAIRKEVLNSDRPDEWRRQFLVWYWSQPRPVKNAGQILLGELEGSNYSKVMKLSAAASLLELEYKPALSIVIAMVMDKTENTAFRETLLESPRAHSAIGVARLTAIARDTGDEPSVREAAVEALKEHGDAGWNVIRTLKADKAIGPRVIKLLEQRDKK